METVSDMVINAKEIRTEADEYYFGKEKQSIESVEKAMQSLEKISDEDKLPASANSDLGTLTEFESTNNLKIPSPIQIGYLKSLISENDRKIKAFLNFIPGNGICIEVNNNNRTDAHQFLQNIGLKVLLSLNGSAINLILIDPDGSGANFKLLLGHEKAKPNLILNKSEIGSKLSDVLKTFNNPNNWQIYFSKIESSAKTFHAFWSCIKGERILNLLDANAPGSGIYTKYGLAK